VFNFNKEACAGLDAFGQWAKTQLSQADLMHADETGINISGKRHWLHCASNTSLTWFYPHTKRGTEAMDEIGILPFFKGVLCHDTLESYYRYGCTHALYNAHHFRELERAWEQEQQWAKAMQVLLIERANARRKPTQGETALAQTIESQEPSGAIARLRARCPALHGGGERRLHQQPG